MTDLAAVLILAAAGVAGLLLIPFGLPGLWVIVLGIVAYGWLTDFRSLPVWLVGLAIALAFLGELLEAWIGFRFAQRYGGSRRAGWGALLGGLIGAVVGVPVPVIGSVIGGFVGAFAGAGLFEYTRARQSGIATESRMGRGPRPRGGGWSEDGARCRDGGRGDVPGTPGVNRGRAVRAVRKGQGGGVPPAAAGGRRRLVPYSSSSPLPVPAERAASFRPPSASLDSS